MCSCSLCFLHESAGSFLPSWLVTTKKEKKKKTPFKAAFVSRGVTLWKYCLPYSEYSIPTNIAL